MYKTVYTFMHTQNMNKMECYVFSMQDMHAVPFYSIQGLTYYSHLIMDHSILCILLIYTSPCSSSGPLSDKSSLTPPWIEVLGIILSVRIEDFLISIVDLISPFFS